MRDAEAKPLKVAIMQPYFFPSLGYYRLVAASDIFVFLDDVNYIKGGWVNRNRILMNGAPIYITVPLRGASSNKQIKDICLAGNLKKILRSIEVAYGRTPQFDAVYPLIKEILMMGYDSISELAVSTIRMVFDYLNLKREFKISSLDFPESKPLEKADRLIDVTHKCGGDILINRPGGRNIYDPDYFYEKGITLCFQDDGFISYPQSNHDFIPNLSVIDALMHNSKDEVCNLLFMQSSVADAEEPKS